MEIKEYRQFMCNPANEFKCEGCPENTNCRNCSLPCGQQNCWVTVHCSQTVEDEEDSTELPDEYSYEELMDCE